MVKVKYRIVLEKFSLGGSNDSKTINEFIKLSHAEQLYNIYANDIKQYQRPAVVTLYEVGVVGYLRIIKQYKNFVLRNE